MKTPQRLIESIQGHQREMSICQGALETIGDLIHRRHGEADLEGISERDLEGFGLAVRAMANAIGTHVEETDGDLDELAILLGEETAQHVA
ncbi:hypothetical protein [Kineobactrum salinum]|uniref:Uncharacterized protein n=1 Tax=Kineobactrum salinum TaxID=2708301 RepID=A0A6C0U8U0_9GAMM|nr:hypothetical protein [Kineobactrum salinum]QIB66975.1 hypothetical protein G3T16_17850 [Kineobactrum salinum]